MTTATEILKSLGAVHYTHMTQSIPSRSWKWGHRCEIRIHRSDVDPNGRGCYERCVAVWGDYDGRHWGPRSEYGRALAEADRVCEMLNTQLLGGLEGNGRWEVAA